MSGSLNDKMGAWRGSRLCPWRRTLHLYVLYTTYLVNFIGQCQTMSAVKISPVTTSTTSTTTYPTTQKPMSVYSCKTCSKTDMKQPACKSVNSCYGTLNCSRDDLKCLFQCNNRHFGTTVSLSIEIKRNCNADPPDNIVVCDQIKGQTLQFEKPASFSETHYNVTCSPVFTGCFCCPSGNRCCDGLWNCKIRPLENPTSSPTTSTKASTTSSRGIISPYTTTTTTPTTTTTTTTTAAITTPTTTTTTTPTTTTTTTTPTTTTTTTAAAITTPTTTTTTTPTTTTTTAAITTTTTTTTTTPTTTTTTAAITTPTTTTTTTTTTPTTTTTTTKTPTTTTTAATKRTATVSTSGIGSSSPEVSTASSLPVTEGRSTASQTDIDYVPTIAVLASLLVLSIIVIGIIVVIVLRRNRRRKEAENSDFIFSNTAYVDVTQHHKTHPGLNNPKSSRELPAKSEDDEEHTYCYPSFDDSKQTESQRPNIQDLPIKTMTYSTNSYSQKHGNNYKINQAIVTEQSVEKDTGHPNETLDSPSNYFVLEKSKSIDDTNGPETCDSANYFVLETTEEDEPCEKRNHEREITETGDTSSGKTDENYFLVDKSDVETTSDNREISNPSFNHPTVENHELTSNENYFVLDKSTDDSKHTETHCNDGLQTSDNTRTGAQPRAKDTPNTTADPYDHVRIGHAHTNGFDDGVYDELRKQNVRYEAEGIENDYDHC